MVRKLVFQNGVKYRKIVVQRGKKSVQCQFNTDVCALNENDSSRTEECTCTLKTNSQRVSLDLKGFSSHNVLLTQMILTDLGSAKNAKEDYEKDIVIAKI